ncbi:hypothetical protein GGR56DRAFT_648636 [Xylariaceae sp. FL0804]|nr:hypothetical protein GGR56DRAFT_648636 [Xylariaceae sp. FL0804]
MSGCRCVNPPRALLPGNQPADEAGCFVTSDYEKQSSDLSAVLPPSSTCNSGDKRKKKVRARRHSSCCHDCSEPPCVTGAKSVLNHLPSTWVSRVPPKYLVTYSSKPRCRLSGDSLSPGTCRLNLSQPGRHLIGCLNLDQPSHRLDFAPSGSCSGTSIGTAYAHPLLRKTSGYHRLMPCAVCRVPFCGCSTAKCPGNLDRPASAR